MCPRARFWPTSSARDTADHRTPAAWLLVAYAPFLPDRTAQYVDAVEAAALVSGPSAAGVVAAGGDTNLAPILGLPPGQRWDDQQARLRLARSTAAGNDDRQIKGSRRLGEPVVVGDECD